MRVHLSAGRSHGEKDVRTYVAPAQRKRTGVALGGREDMSPGVAPRHAESVRHVGAYSCRARRMRSVIALSVENPQNKELRNRTDV